MNTKHKKYKEYNRLQILLDENSTAQKNLGYKELDKPIRDGYNIEYVLRSDIANREDAWLYEALIADFGEKSWCRDKSFEKYNWRTRKKEAIKPSIKKITEREWEKYIPAFQKLWVHNPSDVDNSFWWRAKLYTCIVPEYFFDTKITKHYRTHYKVVDEVLKQEEAEIWDRLYGGHEFREFSWYNGGRKQYGKMRNRADRKYNKQTLKYNMSLQGPAIYYDSYEDDYVECDEDWHTWEGGDVQGKEFRYAHKHSANWDIW